LRFRRRKQPNEEPRELTPEERPALVTPQAWIETQAQEGQPADLSYCDLTNVVWKGDCLTGMILRGASLCSGNLQNADLTNVDLREADLTDADLTGVVNLLPEQLAGANLKRAKLPTELQTFEGLKTAEEMSKNSGKYFIALMAGCLYALLTIVSTSDVGFFTETSTATLPIINVAVSTVGFYWAAPLLLLGAFIYFHMDLQRLWDTLAKLPAVFPDGKPLNEKVYPWLLNGLVVVQSPYLKVRKVPLMWLQKPISIFFAWWATPLTLIFFWGRYLRRHDWPGTNYHIGLIAVAGLASLLFYRLTKNTLQHVENFTASLHPSIWRWTWLYLVVGISLLVVGSDGAIRGISVLPNGLRPTQNGLRPTENQVGWQRHRQWVPILMSRFGYRPFADLAEADISIRPSNWSSQQERGKTIDYSAVKGARLQQRDLQNAILDNTFLVKADLSGAQLKNASFLHSSLLRADMTGADLRWADFRWAYLRGANLSRTNFSRANLDGADLRWAYLGGANLYRAHLHSADLSEAHLDNAHLEKADLNLTNLGGADLRGAYLRGAYLGGAELGNANLQGAHFDGADISGALCFGTNLSGAHLEGAYLRGAILYSVHLDNAHLEGADLSAAELAGASLSEARLDKADLSAADLRDAIGLTQRQLDSAFTDEQTNVSPPLVNRIHRPPVSK
jgi:uncharacterized protein YjbI with pentapeptide repeats